MTRPARHPAPPATLPAAAYAGMRAAVDGWMPAAVRAAVGGWMPAGMRAAVAGGMRAAVGGGMRAAVGAAVRGTVPAGRLVVVLAATGLVAAGCGSGAPTAAVPVAQQQHPLPSSAAPAGARAGLSGTTAAPGTTATPGTTAPPGATPPAGAAGPAGGPGAAPADDRGFRLNVPLPRARFALTDTTGARYDFAARTRGRATLLYFGYTHCPDQCPTMLADIAAALRQLPAAVRSRVTVVFVTTDPQRDTEPVLATFLAQFDHSFVGLTGDTAAVVAAQQAAQIPVSKPTAETTKAPAGSTAHGGGALAYGLDDYAHVTYPAGTSVDDLAHDLPALVAGTGGHA